MSLEQIVNEDFYKNLFRLLNSPRPEATTDLKKICDDLLVMYEARGITEYWPPIPGDLAQVTGEGTSGSADFTPVSARKFEKPIAPTRKDSVAVDHVSPHLSALRSNSPRLASSTAESLNSATIPKTTNGADDQQFQAENGDGTLNNISADSESESFSSAALVSFGSPSFTSGSASDSAKRKSSTDADVAANGDSSQPIKKGDQGRRTRSDETASLPADDEPVEKKPKLANAERAAPATVIQQPQAKAQAKVESSTTGDELDALACVVCKTFALVSAGNLMVECHECHNMYHQKCHQPNVPTSQINDPRMLWYCHQCEKKNQKRADTSAVTSKLTPNGGSAARRNASTSSAREDKKAFADDRSNVFKRSATTESKEKQMASLAPSKPAMAADLFSKAATFLEKHKKKAVPSPPQKTTNSAGNSNPFAMALSSAANSTGSAKLATSTTTGGLSKLASTVQQQSASASSLKPGAASVTASSSSSAVSANAKQLQTSSSQMQAAEKRLQQMKKKAAMKGSYKI